MMFMTDDVKRKAELMNIRIIIIVFIFNRCAKLLLERTIRDDRGNNWGQSCLVSIVTLIAHHKT